MYVLVNAYVNLIERQGRTEKKQKKEEGGMSGDYAR